MAYVEVNGARLFHEVTGDGEPLVVVHGSWSDHASWMGVVPGLARSFRVVTYDRRGHSASEAPPGRGSRRQDEDDLAGLIEGLGLAPVHVAANSFGASTALGLSTRRPELFRSLAVHEPPLMSIVADDTELRPTMGTLQERIDRVLGELRGGDLNGGARRFVEEVAFGPGTWDQLPDPLRQTFIRNAPTFLDEQSDPEWAAIDLESFGRLDRPVLLTRGDMSPPWFPRIIESLAAALPSARTHVFAGAGHAPHVTHPAEYVSVLTDFLATG